MSPRTDTAPDAHPAASTRGNTDGTEQHPAQDPFELDITIVESGPEADRLIRMTDDGCGKTCQSACNSTCP